MRSTVSIILSEFEIEMSIGVYDFEKKDRQRVIIDAHIGLNIHSDFHNDDLQETLNYEEVIKVFEEMASNGHYDLLERFIHQSAHRLLKHPEVESVRIKVCKPDIFKDKSLKSIGVEFYLER